MDTSTACKEYSNIQHQEDDEYSYLKIHIRLNSCKRSNERSTLATVRGIGISCTWKRAHNLPLHPEDAKLCVRDWRVEGGAQGQPQNPREQRMRNNHTDFTGR